MAMISVKEAKFLIQEHTRRGPVHPIPLAMALGATLGTDVTSGSIVLERGAKLTNSSINVLAGIGFTQVEVYRKLSVGIIVTGDGLDELGKDIQFGQVYTSNSYPLTAALREAKVTKINFYNAEKRLSALSHVLKEALKYNDIVILTCGASSGCYDFVLNGSRNVGVTQVFDKVRQKPGKPLYFGKTEKKLIFGLPGNAESVIRSFNQYVLPAIEKLNSHYTTTTSMKNFNRV